MNRSELMLQAATAASETSTIDFKSEADFSSTGTWPELIKDIVAMGNTDGGAIVFGLGDNGQSLGGQLPMLTIKPEDVFDKVRKYTGEVVEGIFVDRVVRVNGEFPVIVVEQFPIPIVFINPGTYELENKKQKSAFSVGAVYFRHGPKSETGTTSDIRRSIERALERTRREWLENVRRITEAPSGYIVSPVAPQLVVADSNGVQVRLTTDPNVQPYSVQNHDQTHPFRQKELLQSVNERLGRKPVVTGHDIQCIRCIEPWAEDPNYVYRPRFGSPQYSHAFRDRVVELLQSDAGYIGKCRTQFKARMREKNRAPSPSLPRSN